MNKWKSGSLVNKTSYSLNGLKRAFLTENAVRRECGMLALFVLLAAIRGKSPSVIFCVFIACLFPIVIELVNTASEGMIDLMLGSAYREDVKDAKDMLSAAVMLSLFIAYSLSLKMIFL